MTGFYPAVVETGPRAHPGLLDALGDWTDAEHAVLADLSYEGEADRLTCPIKKPTKLNTTGAPTAPRTHSS